MPTANTLHAAPPVGGIAAALAALPPASRVAVIESIIDDARAQGFSGFSGRCGLAAVAINRVLFGGSRKLVAAVNETFYRHGGAWVGHVAVLDRRGMYWDADGTPKAFDDIDSWGMLDPDDTDYQERAAAVGAVWDDDAAYSVLRKVVTEARVLSVFTDHEALPTMEAQLRAAARHVLDR